MNIVNVIESYGIEVKQQGQLHVCFCPFHVDRNTPNLVIYPKTNSWYCFACNHGGDVIQFIALKENKTREDVKKRYVDDFITDNLDSFGRKDHNNVNYKDEVRLVTAKVCREFLQNNSDKIDTLFVIMKSFDTKLEITEKVDMSTSSRLIDKFKKRVYNL